MARVLRYLTAFIVWEHLITLDQEIRYFWRRKFTGAAVLFMLNRYIVLVLYALNVSAEFISFTDEVRLCMHAIAK